MALVAAAVPVPGRGEGETEGRRFAVREGAAQVRGRRAVAGLSGVGARAQEAKRGGAPLGELGSAECGRKGALTRGKNWLAGLL
jgi:hypothetical protein